MKIHTYKIHKRSLLGQLYIKSRDFPDAIYNVHITVMKGLGFLMKNL